ncbi:MAG TPA: phage baseplate assembly protein V, partial [Nannocystis sp.]
AMFLPRVGHEVLVDFIEGDPDRPVVTGRVYHGDNKPPYPLPADKTKTTIKSDSSIGGGGFNELRFEDKKGAEEVFLHAQKDLNEVVLNDNSRTVTANQTFSVGGNQSFSITKNRSVTVTEGDESLTVTKGKSSTTVKQDRSVTVQSGNSSMTVETGSRSVTVKQAITEKSTDANIDLTAHTQMSLKAETATVSVTAETDLSLTSNTATLVAMASKEVSLVSTAASLSAQGLTGVSITSLAGPISLLSLQQTSVTSLANVLITGPLGVQVNGGAEVGIAAKKIVLTGGEEVTLQVGSSAITIRADGITISGSKITSTAVGMHEISGALIKIN